MKRGKRHARRRPFVGMSSFDTTTPRAPAGGTVPEPAAMRVIAYGPSEAISPQVGDVPELQAFLARWAVTWVNVEGVPDATTLQALGEVFGLHALVLEDIAHVHQRPKAEQYEKYIFIIARMAVPNAPGESEQLSLVLGENFVLTFQEGRPGDAFDPVRERILKGASHIRMAGADYLAYALLDAVTDGYFPVLEEIGERLDSLEDEVFARPGRQTFARVHSVKRELLTHRRAVWPLREALSSLIRDPNPLIREETRLYLRDCYDHAVRIIDFVETYRELGSDLMDLYVSSVSQRLNEIMKLLTIIATIFIPLTFISSIYGMNFDPGKSPWNMPELRWYWGYPFALLLMLVVAFGLMLYFWRRGWLGGTSVPNDASQQSDPPGKDRDR